MSFAKQNNSGIRTCRECTDAFVGMLTVGQNMTIDNLQACFSAIDRPTTVEMMVHPGHPLKNSDWPSQGCSPLIGPDDFSQSSDRRTCKRVCHIK
ncbi:hypothetical protein ACTXT7_015705 [Hymenolepis weldensis]